MEIKPSVVFVWNGLSSICNDRREEIDRNLMEVLEKILLINLDIKNLEKEETTILQV